MHVMRSSTVFIGMVAAAAAAASAARNLRCLAFLARPLPRHTFIRPRISTDLSRSLSLDMSSTCYEVSVASRDDSKKWIKVALSDADDTTREFNTRKRIQTDITKDTGQQQQPSETDAITSIPESESVLQFERQMKKLAALD